MEITLILIIKTKTEHLITNTKQYKQLKTYERISNQFTRVEQDQKKQKLPDLLKMMSPMFVEKLSQLAMRSLSHNPLEVDRVPSRKQGVFINFYHFPSQKARTPRVIPSAKKQTKKKKTHVHKQREFKTHTQSYLSFSRALSGKRKISPENL